MASARTRNVIITLALAICATGLGCWIVQTMNGLGVTGLSNSFTWGLYIATFAFFVGVAAGGMIVSSSIYVFNVVKLKPFARIASLSAFGCTIAAGVMVILDLGKVNNILNLFIHPNFMSPLLWDVCVITAYMIITFLSVYFQMLPEWKKSGFFLGRWTRKKSIEDVDAFSRRWSRRVAVIGLPFAVLIHTVTALIFATQASREWWHSAILPPDFIAMAVASGTALVLIICMVVVGKAGFEKHRGAFGILARIVAGSLAVHFFFTAMELILLAWTQSLDAAEVLQVVFGAYGPLYAVEIVFPAVAMIFFFMKRAEGSPLVLYGGSILVIVGAFAHRLMLMYPGFNVFPLSLASPTSDELWAYPIASGVGFTSDVFVEGVAYAPTLTELGVALLPFGLALLIIGGSIALARFMPEEDRRPT